MGCTKYDVPQTEWTAVVWWIVYQNHIIRYKPWCSLSDEEKQGNMSQMIPLYNITLPDYGPRYKWTPKEKSLIVDARYYGEILSSVPGGFLAEFAGPYYVISYSTGMIALLNLLRIPFAAEHWRVLMASELIIGLHLGLIHTALFVWIARWSPPTERGIFLASSVGLGLAPTISRIFIRIMLPTTGWRGIFYILSGLIILYLGMLLFLGCNHPEDHKYITPKELYYIKASLRETVTTTSSSPPFGNILTSSAFWALNIANFGRACSSYYFFKVMPNFLKGLLGIEGLTVEYFEKLDYVGHGCCLIVAALIGDFLRFKKLLDDTSVVRLYTIFSHLVPGCTLTFMGMAQCNLNIALSLMFIGYAFSGASVISCYRTIIDISPNYVGTLFGLINASESFARWTLVFLIGGGCVIGTGVIFLFFAIGTSQWWNLKSEDRLRIFSYGSPSDDQTGNQLGRSSTADALKRGRMNYSSFNMDLKHIITNSKNKGNDLRDSKEYEENDAEKTGTMNTVDSESEQENIADLKKSTQSESLNNALENASMDIGNTRSISLRESAAYMDLKSVGPKGSSLENHEKYLDTEFNY